MSNDPIRSLKKLRQRQQDAAEMLWGDGRLRESLPDEQASQLLDWALRYVKSELNITVDLPDEDAEGYMDALVTAVRRLLSQINHLVANLATLDDSEAELETMQFLDRLHQSTGRSVLGYQFELLLPERQTWSKSDIFQRIMDILTTEPEEE
jgi:uncharacterized membrane protein YccC